MQNEEKELIQIPNETPVETEDERMCRIINEDHEIYKQCIQWKGRE